MVKKLFSLLAIMAITSLVLAGCAKTGQKEQASSQGNEIKIGCVLSNSGALATMGNKMTNAAQLAVEEINKAGGINGKQIKLLVEDDATDPATSLQAVKKLVEVDNVKMMIGGMISGAAMTCGPYLSERKVLLLSPSATSPDLTGKPWRDFVFRTAPSDEFQGKVMAQLAVDEGLKKAAVLVMDNTYGVGLGEVIKQTLAGKADVVAFIKYDPNKMDYRTELTQIKGNNPDVVLHVGYNDDGRIVYRQALELGLDKIRWIGCDGVYGTGMFKTKESAQFMQKTMIGTRAAQPSGTAYDNFAKAYKEKFNSDPEVYCDTVYDAMKLIALAANKAASDDTSKIRDALREVGNNYEGASGTITFDQSGDRVTASYEVWKVDKEGEEYKLNKVKVISAK
jgi:ABC-type branched-subunit amino acid transport system substrate-binding protein